MSGTKKGAPAKGKAPAKNAKNAKGGGAGAAPAKGDSGTTRGQSTVPAAAGSTSR